MNKEKLSKLFNNVFVEINTNHNKAVDVYRRYFKQNPTVPILVNFDSHSDLSVNNKLNVNTIANWVNFCIKEFDIDEFYWVVPEHIVKSEDKFLNKSYAIPIKNTNFFRLKDMKFRPLENNSGYIYFSKETNEIRIEYNIEHINSKCQKYGIEPIFDDNEWKKIKVTVLTKEDLGILKNKEILLSVDADYFCNSGFDTTQKLNNIDINKEELLNSFDNFIDKLDENEIKIKCCSLTYSPIYFPSKFKKEIEEFFNSIKQSNKVDG